MPSSRLPAGCVCLYRRREAALGTQAPCSRAVMLHFYPSMVGLKVGMEGNGARLVSGRDHCDMTREATESRTGTSEMMPSCPCGPPRPSPQSSAKGLSPERGGLLPGALARRAGMGAHCSPRPWTPLPAHHPSPARQAPARKQPPASRPALSPATRRAGSNSILLQLLPPLKLAPTPSLGGAACQLHPGFRAAAHEQQTSH